MFEFFGMKHLKSLCGIHSYMTVERLNEAKSELIITKECTGKSSFILYFQHFKRNEIITM